MHIFVVIVNTFMYDVYIRFTITQLFKLRMFIFEKNGNGQPGLF